MSVLTLMRSGGPRLRSARAAAPVARPRLAAALVVLITLLALALAAPARAGTFRVSQCATGDGGLTPRAFQGDLWWVTGGWAAVDCGRPGGRIRVDVANHRLAHNAGVDAFLAVPASMPSTTMRAAWLDWTSMPQAPSTNPASLTIRSGTTRLEGAASGTSASRRYEIPGGARQLSFSTWCSPRNGPGWCNWPGHLFELRGATLELEESGQPAATADGPLLAPGAHAGVEPLEIRATDGDSGVRRVAVTLGGIAVGDLSGSCRDDRLPPCPAALRGTVDVDTRAIADGVHRLRIVVTDAAGNARTLDPATIVVRNQPVADDAPPPSPVPTAPAPASSAPGTAAAKPFPPNPLAGRGHVRNGTHASERARIRVWLEPGGSRRTGRATVSPGVRVRVRGTLTDPHGRPIGRATLAAVRREPGGAWKPVTGVRTRPNGRFTAFTRLGPSQQLRFVYYAYGDSVTGRSSRTLRVTVVR